MTDIIAECEHCAGRWRVTGPWAERPPEHLEGICGDCQSDSDTEKPLTFRRIPITNSIWDPLPTAWMPPVEDDDAPVK
jgi:hypothetical protein